MKNQETILIDEVVGEGIDIAQSNDLVMISSYFADSKHMHHLNCEQAQRIRKRLGHIIRQIQKEHGKR